MKGSMMTKIENKIIEWLKNRFDFIFFIMITILGVIIRYYLKDYCSADMDVHLLSWYEKIQTMGIKSLSTQIGDYNILYQFIIYLLTYLPIKPIYAYKVSILFI